MNLPMRPRSIAFRLIVAVLAVELLSSALVVVLSFGYERHIHFRAFDVMLHGRADSVLGAVEDAEDSSDNVMLNQADLHVPPDDFYQVWDANGRLLGRSTNLQGAGDLRGAVNGQGTGNGKGVGPGVPSVPRGDFSQLKVNGHRYRVLRIEGSRTVDPGERGGGTVHLVTILYGSPTSHVWHVIRGAVEFYAAGSILLLAITGPLIAWLLHRGLLPLRQLAALATQVSVDAWHFSPPDSARTTPELAPLTVALENVLQRLERSFLQQRTFVSDAAHELKTAVAVQKSSLQLLSMKRRSAQEYQAGLERCLADSLRLEAIVADMLTLARAESSTPNADPQSLTNLADCIGQVVTQFETFAALRRVKVLVTSSLPKGLASRVPVAPEDCSVLLSNLLLNALQHSPPESTVEVRLSLETEQSSSTANLLVRDHGDGIAADAMPHVFDRFYRGDPSRARNTGGTGLGLAISNAIVQKAGGAISIASQPESSLPDQGTTVIVRLPVANA
jgi:signal transduction histidine kinase